MKYHMEEMPRSRDYHEELIRALKDHDEAVAYLNAALEDIMGGVANLKSFF